VRQATGLNSHHANPQDQAPEIRIYKPKNQDITEPQVRGPNAVVYTLRNDDADWPIGITDVRENTLPVSRVITDLDRDHIVDEDDLVRVEVTNPCKVSNLYLFAFTQEAESDRKLGTPITKQGGRRTKPTELSTWNDANKIMRASGRFPMQIPADGTTLYIEGMLGGTYKLVIGSLPEGKANDEIKNYTDKDSLECSSEVTLKVAVVVIYQKGSNSNRETAFDVFWGGKPLFTAQVWPAGGHYEWAVPYGAGKSVPGRPITGKAAAMKDDPGENEHDKEIDGVNVTAEGQAPSPTKNSEGTKVEFVGGIEVEHREAGSVPQITNPPTNERRYPDRITVAYTVDGARLVRNEPLEIILPTVSIIPANGQEQNLKEGDAVWVDSGVQYRILDHFSRQIWAWTVEDYLRLYGAGMKAWEALRPEPPHPNQPRLLEDGKHLDDLKLVWVPDSKPVFLQTAQRSQASLLEDRMTKGTFGDTLRFTMPEPVLDYWKLWTSRTAPTSIEEARKAATTRADDYRRAKAKGDQAQIAQLVADDAQHTTSYELFKIRQDVILQLRVFRDRNEAGKTRYDLRVLSGNTITIYTPYFISDPTVPDHLGPHHLHLRFAPGQDFQPQLAPPAYFRPPYND